MTRRILALSRDRGSMQAIAPVLRTLNARGDLSVTTLATRESWPVLEELGIFCESLDEARLGTEPGKYMRELFDACRPELMLSGFSPARGPAPETPEQYAIIEANLRGLASIAVQDYWGMYVERLSRDGRRLDVGLMPTRLCVLDTRARDDLMNFSVPEDRMAITHNPWLDRLVARTARDLPGASCRPARGLRVLLVSQPLAAMRKVRGWPYDQYTLFQTLLPAMTGIPAAGARATLQVLPHPSEELAPWEALLSQAEGADIDVELCRGSTSDLLRDADYLVTSHSTLAYEGLYFGTPCIALRPASEPVMRLWIEEAGLARVFQDEHSLRTYLTQSDPSAERQRVLAMKRKLAAEGLFFSDGMATQRVVAEVDRLLGGANSPSPSTRQ